MRFFVVVACDRWATFTEQFSELEDQCKKLLAGERVAFRSHLGGLCFVSVTTGFLCVDVRQWYLQRGLQEEKPSRVGVGLRMSEWTSLLAIKSSVEVDFPHLATAEPCHKQESHRDIMKAVECRECNPWAK